MLKAINSFGVRWLTRVCEETWKAGEVPKQWETSVTYLQREKKKKCINYRGISLSSLPGKVYAKCFEKRWLKTVEPQLLMHNADFIMADPPWTRSLPFSKFLRNCGNMPKSCIHIFVDLEKAYDRVLRDKL